MTTAQIIFVILGSFFGLVVLLATSLAVFRASYLKEQVGLLRADRDDLRASRDELKSRLQVVEKDLAEEKRKVLVLEQIVTGKELLEGIQRDLHEHDVKNDRHMRAIHDTVEEVVDLLEGKEQRDHDDG